VGRHEWIGLLRAGRARVLRQPPLQQARAERPDALAVPRPKLVEVERAGGVLPGSGAHPPFLAIGAIFHGDLRRLAAFCSGAHLRPLVAHPAAPAREGPPPPPPRHPEPPPADPRPTILPRRLQRQADIGWHGPLRITSALPRG